MARLKAEMEHNTCDAVATFSLSDEFFNACQTSSEPAVSDEIFDELQMDPNCLASIAIALALLGRKTKFYRSQLRLPEKDSDDFKKMKPEFQDRMRKFYPNEDNGFWKRCVAFFKRRKFLDCAPAPSDVFAPAPSDVAMNSLNRLLDEMQQLSLDILDEAATRE
ncbi:Hypothetical predicted protein, partial [Paramuricea clavata]